MPPALDSAPGRRVTDPEPPPTRNSGQPCIQDLCAEDLKLDIPGWGSVAQGVIDDLAKRKQHGIAKYGTPLQPFNGRDAAVDAYQEAIDLMQYSRQKLHECKTMSDAFSVQGADFWAEKYAQARDITLSIKSFLMGQPTS